MMLRPSTFSTYQTIANAFISREKQTINIRTISIRVPRNFNQTRPYVFGNRWMQLRLNTDKTKDVYRKQSYQPGRRTGRP